MTKVRFFPRDQLNVALWNIRTHFVNGFYGPKVGDRAIRVFNTHGVEFAAATNVVVAETLADLRFLRELVSSEFEDSRIVSSLIAELIESFLLYRHRYLSDEFEGGATSHVCTDS